MTTTNPSACPTFREICETLKADGFQLIAPPWIKSAALKIDADVCSELECDHCGYHGLTCHPAHHVENHSYVALAVCPWCFSAKEF